MPSEKFYAPTTVEGDEQVPVLTIAWGAPGTGRCIGPRVNDVVFDRSAINRMIGTLRRARDQVFGVDA